MRFVVFIALLAWHAQACFQFDHRQCGMHPECLWTQDGECRAPEANCTQRTMLTSCWHGTECQLSFDLHACVNRTGTVHPLYEHCRARHPNTSTAPTLENTVLACLSDPLCQWSAHFQACSPTSSALCESNNRTLCRMSDNCHYDEESGTCSGMTPNGNYCTLYWRTPADCGKAHECEWDTEKSICVNSPQILYSSVRAFCNRDYDGSPMGHCFEPKQCERSCQALKPWCEVWDNGYPYCDLSPGKGACWFGRKSIEACRSIPGCGWTGICELVGEHEIRQTETIQRILWAASLVIIWAVLLVVHTYLKLKSKKKQ